MLTPIQWLIDFLICLVQWGVGILLAGLMGLVNLLIAGLMALVGLVTGLLPTIDLGEVSLPGFVAQLNWLFPMDHFVALTGVILTVLAVWHLVAIGLRWAKVIE